MSEEYLAKYKMGELALEFVTEFYERKTGSRSSSELRSKLLALYLEARSDTDKDELESDADRAAISWYIGMMKITSDVPGGFFQKVSAVSRYLERTLFPTKIPTTKITGF